MKECGTLFEGSVSVSGFSWCDADVAMKVWYEDMKWCGTHGLRRVMIYTQQFLPYTTNIDCLNHYILKFVDEDNSGLVRA